MGVWAALWWGAFSAASLYAGEALAAPLSRNYRATGLMMAFGAGTLLSAVAYELVPETNLSHGGRIGLGFLTGALVYYLADRIVDSSGGEDRQNIASGEAQGSGAAMFIGALLDGIPEAFVLGISFALGGSVSVAFVAAVFVSNIPQGVAGTTSLRAAGHSGRIVFRMWTAVVLACALASVLGYVIGHATHIEGLFSEAFAAGAVLTMLADSMMPESFEHGGKAAGLLVVLGYAAATVLVVLQ